MSQPHSNENKNVLLNEITHNVEIPPPNTAFDKIIRKASTMNAAITLLSIGNLTSKDYLTNLGSFCTVVGFAVGARRGLSGSSVEVDAVGFGIIPSSHSQF